MSQDQNIKAIQEKFANRFTVLQAELARELEQLKSATSESGSDPCMASFLACVRELRQGYSQSVLLNALLDHLGELAPRVCMLILKDQSLAGWSARGFGDEFQSRGVKKVHWTILEFPELVRAIEQGESFEASYGDLGDIADSISAFDDFSPVKSAFLPISIRNKTAGLIYLDSGDTMDLPDLEVLELLVHIASMELTMVTTKLKKKPKKPTPEPVAAKKEPTQQPEPEATPEPEPKVTQDAVKTAPTPEPAIALPSHEDMSREEKKARRVARVLISDLILYNQEKVNEGRILGNLYDLLKEDIDRSYEHYQSRTKEIDPKENYFKIELIDQVAEGNTALLGAIPF